MKCFNKGVSRYLQQKYEPTSDDLSLDEFTDNMNDDDEASFEPTGSTEALDDAEILVDLFNALIEDLNCKDPRYGEIINLLYQGYNKNEVISKIEFNTAKLNLMN